MPSSDNEHTSNAQHMRLQATGYKRIEQEDSETHDIVIDNTSLVVSQHSIAPYIYMDYFLQLHAAPPNLPISQRF